jgi:hypothetical protein
MPNAHAADKEVMGFYIPRTLARKVRKAAKAQGLTVTAFIEQALTHGTRHIELSPEDYEEIAKATRCAIHDQARKISRKKSEGGSKS